MLKDAFWEVVEVKPEVLKFRWDFFPVAMRIAIMQD